MKRTITGPVPLTIAAGLLLGLVVLLSSASEVPTVSLASVQLLDDGSEVLVYGVIADVKRFDSGTERLVLVDIEDGSTLAVYCPEGSLPQPDEYADVGDEVRARGVVSNSGGTVSLFCDPGQITLVRPSEAVLTVEALSRHWDSFFGDTVTISGVLVRGPDDAELRLADRASAASVAVRSDTSSLLEFSGSSVTVHGRLAMDASELALVFEVHWIRLDG